MSMTTKTIFTKKPIINRVIGLTNYRQHDMIIPSIGVIVRNYYCCYNGTFITKWGTNGTADGQFNDPWGVAIDSSGSVYVADYGNNRIQKFDSNGKFITKWGTPGSDDGKFSGPAGVAVDSSGNVYVADLANDRIQVFSPL